MHNGDGLAARSRLVRSRSLNGSAGLVVAQVISRFAFAYPSSPGYGYGGGAYGTVKYGGTAAPTAPTTVVTISPLWANGQAALPGLAGTQTVARAWADGQVKTSAPSGTLGIFSPFADGQANGLVSFSTTVPRAWTDGQVQATAPSATRTAFSPFADGQVGPAITTAEGIFVTISPVWADGLTAGPLSSGTATISRAWADGQGGVPSGVSVAPRAWADGQVRAPSQTAALAVFSAFAAGQTGPGVAGYSGIIVVISPIWGDGQAGPNPTVGISTTASPVWADGQVTNVSHGAPIATWTTNQEFALGMSAGIEGRLQLSVPVVTP